MLIVPIVAMIVLAGCTTNDSIELGSRTEQPSPKPSQEPLSLQGIEATSSNQEIVMEQIEVTLETAKGEIVLELYPEYAPKTVANFVQKVKDGEYDARIFHRVEDWVVQGGDPLGNGTGGGEQETELSKVPFVEGSLGIARGGNIRISNDSQFFICTTDCQWLTGQYTWFGKVTKGMDIVKQLAIGDKITKMSVQEN